MRVGTRTWVFKLMLMSYNTISHCRFCGEGAWSGEPRKKALLKIRVTRLCARRSRTSRPLPIIPKLLSFRLAILGQYLPFHAPVPRERSTKERGLLHGRATTHWLKIITHRLQRGHLPTIRCPLLFLPPPSFPILFFLFFSFFFLFLLPTLRLLLIYLAVVPAKTEQAAEETWQTN